MSPVKRSEQEKTICCREWMGLSVRQRAEWPWQVVHRFAHSRTTFSAATVAELARVDADRAAELIGSAEMRKWIWTPQAGVWVGRLASRR